MTRGKRNEPTVTPTAEDYLYAAGFTDGEGCITVRRSTNRRPEWNPSMYASVTISQADPYGAMLTWFADRWGGAVRKKPQAGTMARDAWEWCIVGRQAYVFLAGVRPYLKIKGPQADNALRLKTMRDARPVVSTGWRRPMSPREVALQSDVLAEARRLNLRGRIEVQ
jgi:hypothetical protein